MRESTSRKTESEKVVPFKERADLAFDIFVRKYLPEKPTPADLTMGTIAYIKDRGLNPNNPDDKPKVNRIIKEFNERFFKKFSEFGAQSVFTPKKKKQLIEDSKKHGLKHPDDFKEED